MDITRKEREELNALSKEIFGSSSKWQKYITGISELVTRTVKEVVPGDKGAPDTTKDVQIPVLLDGAKQYKTKFYTLIEIKEMLLKFKVQRDQIIAQMKAADDEKKAAAQLKQTQKEVQNLAAGSSSL